MREFAILPDGAHGAITESRTMVLSLLAMNIAAEKPKMSPAAIEEIVLSFFSGLCIERNLKSAKRRRLERWRILWQPFRTSNRATGPLRSACVD